MLFSEKDLQTFILFTLLVFMALAKAWGALLCAILFFGFYVIVVNNEKYGWLKEKFESIL